MESESLGDGERGEYGLERCLRDREREGVEGEREEGEGEREGAGERREAEGGGETSTPRLSAWAALTCRKTCFRHSVPGAWLLRRGHGLTEERPLAVMPESGRVW